MIVIYIVHYMYISLSLHSNRESCTLFQIPKHF